MKKILFIGTFLFFVSCLIFVYVIHKKDNSHTHVLKPVVLNKKEKVEYTLFFYNYQKGVQVEKIFLFSVTPSQDCFKLVSQWLLQAWQRRIITAPIKCQSVILDSLMTTVFISFDFPLFDDTAPLYVKITIINNLLKTVQQVSPAFQYVYLLVRHEPIVDKYVDWIKPFSISGYPVLSF